MKHHLKNLLTWYRTHGRDLPWRTKRPDAYRIFISEMMLQQTQVDRVLPFFRAWFKHFFSWKKLAQAKRADVIKAWSGLGYNRRALWVQEAAQSIVEHGVPKNEMSWRKLKGVGPYAAAALAAFINHEPTIVIDTNIRRVIGRWHDGKLFPSPQDDPSIRRVLKKRMPQHRHWDIPQALMDLGATVCTARKPACDICPLRATCRATKKFRLDPNAQPQRIPNKERIHLGKLYPDRIYRGRILMWIKRNGQTTIKSFGKNVDESYQAKNDREWMENMIKRLVKDGLLQRKKDSVDLP